MPWRQRFDAVLFDLDGTLVETAPDLADALNHTLRSAGLPTVSLADVRPMIGDGARRMLQRGIAGTGRQASEAEMDRWFEQLLGYYSDHIADQSRPFAGVVDQLERLQAAGIKLGVCTNKPVRLSERLLQLLGLADYFGAVLGGDSLVVRKPHAEHVLATLAAIDAAPDRAVLIGDSANDVNAARNAGLPVVVVSFGYTEIPARELAADAVIDHFDELPAALAALP